MENTQQKYIKPLKDNYIFIYNKYDLVLIPRILIFNTQRHREIKRKTNNFRPDFWFLLMVSFKLLPLEEFWRRSLIYFGKEHTRTHTE